MCLPSIVFGGKCCAVQEEPVIPVLKGEAVYTQVEVSPTLNVQERQIPSLAKQDMLIVGHTKVKCVDSLNDWNAAC